MSLTGVIPPVVTPLTASGDFDYESFARNANRMIDAGVHGLFAMGSSGEVAFSTSERRDEVTSAAIEVAAGRVPVVVGVIDMQTTRVIEHARLRGWSACR